MEGREEQEEERRADRQTQRKYLVEAAEKTVYMTVAL